VSLWPQKKKKKKAVHQIRDWGAFIPFPPFGSDLILGNTKKTKEQKKRERKTEDEEDNGLEPQLALFRKWNAGLISK